MHQEDLEFYIDNTGCPCLKEKAPDGNGAILLQGQFPSTRLDDSIIYSATLRLNSDLANYDHSFLKRLALCEKYRQDSTSVRSYIREYHPEVALIGQSDAFIDNFLDTYSGVLNLVLVRKEPDSTISIFKKAKGLMIEKKAPTPLDPTSCIMCRKCVSACKKGAITPKPRLELTKCNFCGECEKLCPTNAIDLHRENILEIFVDEVILENELDIKVDKQVQSHLFSKNRLEPLFKKIGSFEVEEAVEHNLEDCAYDSRLEIGCKRCVSVCNVSALEVGSKGITINQALCLECGECVSTCPTGAMAYQRFPDKVFLKYFSDLCLPKGTTVVIGREKELKNFWWHSFNKRYRGVFFLEHPQPGAISSIHLLWLLAIGASRVIIVEADKYKEKTVINKAAFVNSATKDLLGLQDDFVSTCTVKELEQELDGKNPSISFQEDIFFHHLETELKNRQKATSKLLWLLAKRSPKLVQLPFTIKSNDFAQITVNDTCTLCLACLNVCSPNALMAKEEEGVRLIFDSYLCINCKACEEVCPEDAISLTPGLVIDRDFPSEKILAEDEPMRCKRCGKAFGNKKSFDRAMEILTQSGRYLEKELSVLYLCEECRAVVMLEDILK